MAKAAIKKKVGRPAKKAVGRPAKKVAAKRKPRVSKKKAEQSFEERMGWRFDHVSQKWTKPLEGFTLE